MLGVFAFVDARKPLDECVLHEVQTGVVIQAHAARMAIERLVMARDQSAIRLAVAMPDTSHQCAVAHRQWPANAHHFSTTSTATWPPMPSSLRPACFFGTNHSPRSSTNA